MHTDISESSRAIEANRKPANSRSKVYSSGSTLNNKSKAGAVDQSPSPTAQSRNNKILNNVSPGNRPLNLSITSEKVKQ